MKIKLAILENDQGYLSRIAAVFNTRYADKFEVYSFTDKAIALSTLETAKIDVLVASDSFDIDVNVLPKRCGFAYLVDSAEMTEFNGQKVICKFQKAELIYKGVLSIYSEKAEALYGIGGGNTNCQVLMFQAAGGGVGVSSMAAACALHIAAQGKKVLYLNLERYGASDVFFSADGSFCFSDVIYALKSRKTNLSLKLESCVKRDPRGVDFYEQPRVALDMLEMNGEDTLRLISELKAMGNYDYIIIDRDFGLDQDSLALYRQAHTIVWVSDGSETANAKTQRAYHALEALERNADVPVLGRIALVYNRFSNKTGHLVADLGLRSLGGAPRYEHMDSRSVMEQLSKLSVFDSLMQG